MTRALAFEWQRIRTVRSTYWLTALALVLSGAVAGLIAGFSRDNGLDDEMIGIVLTGGTQFIPLPFAPLFMGIIGAFAFGHEYRHNLILSTLTAIPRRVNLVIAKVIILAVWALVVAVVSILINWGLATGLTGERLPLVDDPTGPALLAYIGYVVLWAMLGLAVGMLVRNLPATLVVLMLVPLIVEPTVVALISFIDAFESLRPATPYFPFTAGNGMIATVSAEGGAFGGTVVANQPSRGVSALTFTAWIAAVLLPAWALFHKRDA